MWRGSGQESIFICDAKLSGANGDKKKIILFPVHLAKLRSGNHAGSMRSLLEVMMTTHTLIHSKYSREKATLDALSIHFHSEPPRAGRR